VTVPIRSLTSTRTTPDGAVSGMGPSLCEDRMISPGMALTKPAGVLLTPGASGTADHPVFLAVEDRLAADGVAVRRYDFEHRRAGRRSSPRAEAVVPELIEAVGSFADELGVGTAELVAGGRSYGGRVCSLAAADGLPLAGLALLSYPLHPPGRPDRLRVDHFPLLSLPVLFVSGDRDPFGAPDEIASHAATIPGPVATTWVEGGTHDPRHRGREAAVVDALVAWVTGLRRPRPRG
jgi:uncharacterized protein